MKVGNLVKSKLAQHTELTTWRIVEITKSDRGFNWIMCEAAHDTGSRGFNKMGYEFKEFELELA